MPPIMPSLGSHDCNHPSIPAKHSFRLSIRGLLASTLAVLAALAVGVTGAGGTYALWNASEQLPSATVRSGTAELAVASGLAMPAEPLYPDHTVYGTATIVNTGDVDLTPAVTGLTSSGVPDDFSRSLAVGAGVVSSVGACAAGTFTPTWTGTIGTVSAGALGGSIPIGASRIVCVSVTMSPVAPIGALGQPAAAFSLALTGTQV